LTEIRVQCPCDHTLSISTIKSSKVMLRVDLPSPTAQPPGAMPSWEPISAALAKSQKMDPQRVSDWSSGWRWVRARRRDEGGEGFSVARTGTEPAGHFSITEIHNLTPVTIPTFCRGFHPNLTWSPALYIICGCPVYIPRSRGYGKVKV
jgi:hypothetical protein